MNVVQGKCQANHECTSPTHWCRDCQKTRLLLDWMDKSLVSTRVSLFDVHNEPPRRFSYQHVSVLYEQATIDEALKRYAEESSRVQFNIFLGSSPLTNDDPDLVVERLEKWGKLGYLLVSQDHKPDGLGFKCDAYHTPAYEAFMRRGLEVGDEILGTDWFKHCKQTCHIVEEPTWYHYMAFKHPDGGEFPAFKSYKFSESELVNLFEIAGLSVLWKRQEGTMGMYLLIGRSVDAKLLPSWVADKLAQPLGIDI